MEKVTDTVEALSLPSTSLKRRNEDTQTQPAKSLTSPKPPEGMTASNFHNRKRPRSSRKRSEERSSSESYDSDSKSESLSPPVFDSHINDVKRELAGRLLKCDVKQKFQLKLNADHEIDYTGDFIDTMRIGVQKQDLESQMDKDRSYIQTMASIRCHLDRKTGRSGLGVLSIRFTARTVLRAYMWLERVTEPVWKAAFGHLGRGYEASADAASFLCLPTLKYDMEMNEDGTLELTADRGNVSDSRLRVASFKFLQILKLNYEDKDLNTDL